MEIFEITHPQCNSSHVLRRPFLISRSHTPRQLLCVCVSFFVIRIYPLLDALFLNHHLIDWLIDWLIVCRWFIYIYIYTNKTYTIYTHTKGLQRWEASRRRWLHHSATTIPDERGGTGGNYVGGNIASSTTTSTTTTTYVPTTNNSSNNSNNKTVAIPLDVDEIIDILFAPRWRGGSVPTIEKTTEASSAGPNNMNTNNNSINNTPTSPTSTAGTENENNANDNSPPPPATTTTTTSQVVPVPQEVPPPSFPVNVPLPQMVDVLVDLWEAEGLDLWIFFFKKKNIRTTKEEKERKKERRVCRCRFFDK